MRQYNFLLLLFYKKYKKIVVNPWPKYSIYTKVLLTVYNFDILGNFVFYRCF